MKFFFLNIILVIAFDFNFTTFVCFLITI